MNSHSVLVLVLIGPLGCASDGGEEPGNQDVRSLTCAVMTGPNCWTEAVAEVALCAPSESSQGLFDPTNRLCEYVDGTVVDLSDTTLADRSLDQKMNFGMDVNEEPCVRMFMPEADDETALEITTASGKTTYEYGDIVRLTCPDGVTYEADAFAVLGCEGIGSHLPGWTGAYDAELLKSVSFSLLSSEGTVPVFDCTDEPFGL